MSKTVDDNVFTDLSGSSATTHGNPYNSMLEACTQDSRQIQQRYQNHREARNEQQKAKLLSPDFAGFTIDPVLEKLINKEANPGYTDPRNCLVFWGRPPARIRRLVDSLQERLLKTAPSLWLMPLEKLHLTAMEMTHSKSPVEISQLVDKMHDHIPGICNYPHDHRCRLVKPALGYDGAAIALSFLPAASETSPSDPMRKDSYTYHHFRRDLYDMCEASDVKVASRYVLPSAHLTIARFVNQNLHREGNVGKLVEELEAINAMLRETTWGISSNSQKPIEWIVGEGKGLVCRKMTVWYGDGESHYEGKGFSEIA